MWLHKLHFKVDFFYRYSSGSKDILGTQSLFYYGKECTYHLLDLFALSMTFLYHRSLIILLFKHTFQYTTYS